MDKLKYVAKRLNMLPYRSEVKKEIVEFAKENGIVIVYGESDDLMELDGAIYDEFGCYEGGVCCLDSEGNILEKMTNNCRTIEAVWCGKGEKFTWTYKTDIPHETYEIYDDAEPYCKGIVFYKKDLAIRPVSEAVNTYEEMNNKIVGILRLSDQHYDLYAAKYIEELQSENKLLKEAHYSQGGNSPSVLELRETAKSVAEDLGVTQNEYTKELLQLVRENPDLPILPMVDSEIVAEDGYNWWLGSFGHSSIDEFVCTEYHGDNRYFRKEEQDLIEEYIAEDVIDCEGENLSDEEIEKRAHEIAEALPWKKAILVWIGLPEVED